MPQELPQCRVVRDLQESLTQLLDDLSHILTQFISLLPFSSYME